MNKSLYCDFVFLKRFSSSCPKRDENPLNDDPVEAWRHVFQFIYNSNFQVIDCISYEDLVQEMRKKSLLWILLKGRKCYHSNVHDFIERNIETGFKQVIFLTSDSKTERQSLSSAFGIIVLGNEDVLTLDKAFRRNLLHLNIEDNKSYTSWNDLDLPTSICISNSMVVVDNYVLKDTKKFEQNLYSLLDKLLPERTEIEYHISIFTKVFGSDFEMQLRFDKVNNKIKSIRPKLKFALEIRDADEQFHNRKVVTNNVYISCDKGFDLFPIRKDGADINIVFPAFSDSGEEKSYDSLIKELSNIKYRKECKHVWCNNPVSNRLLEKINTIL